MPLINIVVTPLATPLATVLIAVIAALAAAVVVVGRYGGLARFGGLSQAVCRATWLRSTSMCIDGAARTQCHKHGYLRKTGPIDGMRCDGDWRRCHRCSRRNGVLMMQLATDVLANLERGAASLVADALIVMDHMADVCG